MASCNGPLWLLIQDTGVAISSRILSCPLPKRHRNLPNIKRLCRNNPLHHRRGRIGCDLQAPLARRYFWSDAPSAATAPRSVHTDRLRFIRRTGHRSFLRIRCRVISARMCPALQLVPPRRCFLSKDAGRYEWVSRLSRTESARQDKGVMPAHRNVPRMRYPWILTRSVLW